MTNLAKIMKLYLAANDISAKTMAEQLEISSITLSRFLSGKNIDVTTFIVLLNWLAKEAA